MIKTIIKDDNLYVKYTGDKIYFNEYINAITMMEEKQWCQDNLCWKFPKSCLKAINSIFAEYELKEFKKHKVTDYQHIGSDMKMKPYDYQKEVIKFIIDNNEALIIAPCGSGKTPIGIGAFLEAKKNNIIKGPGFIIVKASLKTQWLKEIGKFSNEKARIIQTESEMTSSSKDKIKRRKKKLKSIKDKELKKSINNEIKLIQQRMDTDFNSQFVGCDLYIMNYETLRDEAVRKKLRFMKADYMFMDEIQYLKSHTSKRSKAASEFSNIKIKVGATATPVTKDPQDIYGLFKVIKPDLFESFSKFARSYIKYSGPGRISGFKDMDKLRAQIAPYVLVKTKEEVSSQLPKLLISQRYCEMTPQQAEVNETIMMDLEEVKEQEYLIRSKCKNEFEVKNNPEIMQLEGKIMALQTFAQELVCSPELLKMSDSEMSKSYYFKSSNPKLELCSELVSQIIESGEKVCIFSRYKSMQLILTEMVNKIDKKIKVAYVNGSLNDKQRYQEVYEKFQGKEEYKVLLMSDAGAEGINLGKIKYLIEYEPAISFAIQTQRHGRLERADSVHDTVFIYQLIVNDSYDEIAQKIVNKKEAYDLDIIKSLV